ncbi:MAG: putative sulfate exporter family transporter [Polyangia bacterium]
MPLLLLGLASLFVSPALALLAGIAYAIVFGNRFAHRTRLFAHRSLTWSVVGLGAGMNLAVVARVGLHGLGYTVVGIGLALSLGTLLGRKIGVGKDVSLLVTVGTAICGGSAIAAVAPVVRAKEEDVSMALVTIFLLNAVALLVFPVVGHALAMKQDAFGLWCALAIHDTSSVVGAASQYGTRALEVATAAKLARALWIVPVTFAISLARARGGESTAAPKRPWFIAGFVGIAALVTFVPPLQSVGHLVAAGAHRLLSLTLFLIGLGMSRDALRGLGVRPLVQAVALWLALATLTLLAITTGLIG